MNSAHNAETARIPLGVRLWPLLHPWRTLRWEWEMLRVGHYAYELAHRVASGTNVYPWPDAPQDVAYLAFVIHNLAQFDGSGTDDGR